MLQPWKFSWLAAMALATAVGSLSQAQVKLEVKIPDNEKTTSTVTINSKQSLVINGMNIDTGSEQQMLITTTNGKRAADGVLRQEQKIESVKAKLSLPGGVSLQYDSTQPDAPAPGTAFDILLDLLKVNAHASWTVVRGLDNRITAIEGREKVLEKLNETQRSLLKKQLDPAYLRDVANKELEKLPNKPVTKGDTWEVTETMRLEQGQNMTFKTKYTYQGAVERDGQTLDQIDAQAVEVHYTIDADAPLPLKVNGADLKSNTLEGVIYFNRQLGRIVESRSKTQITGTIHFEAGGKALPAQLDLTLANSSVTK